ncbi:MAG: histidine--tRNA ligase [Actinobacteria bacterium]|nr:histidine--tRNA ligase [Actinomycetota bacterium]
MHDLFEPETTRRRALVRVFAERAERAGYGEVRPPVLEELGVFLRMGEATDVVSKEMYEFEDKDGRRVALRPELTAGVVRAFVQHHPPTPWKVWYAGTSFRRERPAAGRYRAFDQIGAEVLGVDDPDLDVEVISLAWSTIAALGLSDVRLIINSLGDQVDRQRYSESVAAYLADHRDELSEAARATAERNPLRVLDTKRPEDRAVVASAPSIAEFRSEASAAHFERVLAGLSSLGIPFGVEERLVRGLDYYRRTTFEIVADSLDAAQNAVGGGGRYDGLAEDLGGPPTDGIGFALGIDRLLLACDAEAVFPAPPTSVDVYVVDTTDGAAARNLVHQLREAGLAADRRYGGGSLKSQMKSADRSGARWAVLIGSDELSAGEVTLRNLRADGEQLRVASSDVRAALLERLHTDREDTTA